MEFDTWVSIRSFIHQPYTYSRWAVYPGKALTLATRVVYAFIFLFAMNVTFSTLFLRRLGLLTDTVLSCQAANPIKHVDANGNISWESGAEAVEVRFGIPKGMQEVVKAAIEQDLGPACKL